MGVAEDLKERGFALQLERDVPRGTLRVRKDNPLYAACHPDDAEGYVAGMNLQGIDVLVIDLTVGAEVWRRAPPG